MVIINENEQIDFMSFLLGNNLLTATTTKVIYPHHLYWVTQEKHNRLNLGTGQHNRSCSQCYTYIDNWDVVKATSLGKY